ncbi:MAG TPA: hypothetical protein VK669_04925 [Candidatus Limnocylindrales bacterium]|nr:hypothetical protein [Candidatus Limnocylindrales bacterium]
MEVPVIVALVGLAGTAAGIGLKATVDSVVSARSKRQTAREVTTTLRNLYRNAFMQLNGAMRIGYVDSTERFREVLQLAIGRASGDEISKSFPQKVADMVHASVPALLDSLYGCMEAQNAFNALPSDARDDRRTQEILFERVRHSASVGLALVMVVLTEIGDDAYVGQNLWKPNAKRVLKYMDEERKLAQAEEEQARLTDS